MPFPRILYWHTPTADVMVTAQEARGEQLAVNLETINGHHSEPFLSILHIIVLHESHGAESKTTVVRHVYITRQPGSNSTLDSSSTSAMSRKVAVGLALPPAEMGRAMEASCGPRPHKKTN